MSRILVIDDDPRMRKTIVRMLTDAGYDVTEAADGYQGLKRFKAEHADMVITDIVMPDMEGIETMSGLRKLDPQVPIIAMSGGGPDLGKLYLDIAGELGADATLVKPFRAAQLVELVADVSARRRPALARP